MRCNANWRVALRYVLEAPSDALGVTHVPLPIDLSQPVPDAARALLGCIFVHIKGARCTSGRIVEVEAYGGAGEDACSHANVRRTARNAVMYGPPGRLYVYFTYGMHHCANIVAHEPGLAGAVLLRALEPLDGIDLMRRRRGVDNDRLCCSGPARLVQAVGLRRADDGRRLDSARLHLLAGEPPTEVIASHRIGVKGRDADRPWRFCDAGSDWLSRPP